MFARGTRAVATLARSAVPARRMGGGHGHGPAKTLPPRPALPENAGLKQKIQHAMWYKRHPDFEGAESYVRYYLPHNHNLVYAVLGLYAGIVVWARLNSKASARVAVHNAPAPETPDYHTPIVVSGVPELSVDPEAWSKFVQEEGGVEKWIMAGVSDSGAATSH